LNDRDDEGGPIAREVPRVLKRKYVKPALITEAIFEAAAGCGKADPSQFQCSRVPREGS
jgi:hypothetical protein